MTNEEIIQKGDLYYMESKAARIGRPVVIMSSFLLNDIRDEVLCIPLSKNNLTELPTHYKVSNKQYEGYAICEKPFTASKELLTEKVTRLSDKDINEIDKRMCIVFEVGQGVRANNDVIKRLEKEYRKSSKAEDDEKKIEIESAIAEVSEDYEQKIAEYRELMREMDERYRECESALDTERKERERSESEQVRKLSAEHSTLNTQYLHAVEQKKYAQTELEAEKRTSADLRNENKNLQVKCKKLENEKTVAENRRKEDVIKLNMEKENAEEKAREAVEKAKEAEKRAGEADEEIRRVRKEADSAKEKVRELENWKTELDRRIEELESMQVSGMSSDSDLAVELETATMERDMYKNKYMETAKKLRKAGI